jgi:hypothetical protein
VLPPWRCLELKTCWHTRNSMRMSNHDDVKELDVASSSSSVSGTVRGYGCECVVLDCAELRGTVACLMGAERHCMRALSC